MFTFILKESRDIGVIQKLSSKAFCSYQKPVSPWLSKKTFLGCAGLAFADKNGCGRLHMGHGLQIVVSFIQRNAGDMVKHNSHT